MKTKPNTRQKHLAAICTKIATFLVTETYAGEEQDLQNKLTQAIRLIDEVAAACVVNDDKAAREQSAP